MNWTELVCKLSSIDPTLKFFPRSIMATVEGSKVRLDVLCV